MPVPRSVYDARNSSYAAQWFSAMEREMYSHRERGTWQLTPFPPGAKVVGSTWVFAIKRDQSGQIVKFKARLCARGFSQTYGVDFTETFAPVARSSTLRLQLALAAQRDQELHQVDVETAFLNGKLHEVVYMRQPQGFLEKGKEDHVCRLIRPIYGLKQAAKEWFDTMVPSITDFGFKQSTADPCLFIRFENDELATIVTQVDDFSIAADDLSLMTEIKKHLGSKFKIRDLGELKWFLGLQVTRDRPNRSLTISQSAYIISVLQRFGMEDCKPMPSPESPGAKLSKADSPTSMESKADMESIPYRSAVGSMMYATVMTRPDIANAVRTLASFNQNPGLAHWKAAKRVLRYLKGTINKGIRYDGRESAELVIFADADWANNPDTRRSVTGWVSQLCGGPISWKSRTQRSVARSSTEAEFMAAASDAAAETLFLQRVLHDFGILQPTVTMFQDNQGAIALAQNPRHHSRTKHIDTRIHFIRDTVNANKIRLQYLPTNEMLADILTKPIAGSQFKKLRERLMGWSSQRGGV